MSDTIVSIFVAQCSVILFLAEGSDLGQEKTCCNKSGRKLCLSRGSNHDADVARAPKWASPTKFECKRMQVSMLDLSEESIQEGIRARFTDQQPVPCVSCRKKCPSKRASPIRPIQ